jgi:hypothetical protein
MQRRRTKRPTCCSIPLHTQTGSIFPANSVPGRREGTTILIYRFTHFYRCYESWARSQQRRIPRPAHPLLTLSQHESPRWPVIQPAVVLDLTCSPVKKPSCQTRSNPWKFGCRRRDSPLWFGCLVNNCCESSRMANGHEGMATEIVLFELWRQLCDRWCHSYRIEVASLTVGAAVRDHPGSSDSGTASG